MKIVPKDDPIGGKTKVVRFSELVKIAGKPEMLTLWADPQKDKSFMGFVKKNRIVTVVQNPAGHKMDFGIVGFHPQPFAAFMFFPKSLSPENGTRIVGIKYDLFKDSGAPPPFEPKIVKAAKPEPGKPIELSFTVRLRRSLSQEFEFMVKGKTPQEVKAKALALAAEALPPAEMKIISDRIVSILKTD